MAFFDNPLFEPADGTGEEPDDEETSFINPPAGRMDAGLLDGVIIPQVTSSLQQELLQSAVDDYYNALAQKGLTPSLGRDPLKFELVGGQLRLKAYPNLSLTNIRTRAPLALSTVASRGGGSAILEELGFVGREHVTRVPKQLRSKAITALQTANNELGGAAAAVNSVELQALGQTAKEASDVVTTMETTLTDTEIEKVLGTMADAPLSLRELRGLDKALQTTRGELTNNLAKLSELDDHIALEKRKLDEANTEGVDEFSRRRIAERLRSLEDERAARLEAATANREALRSQINRIRETLSRILNENTTLAERIRTLFREQGITIAAILTAFGMAISTLVLTLTGGGVPTPTPAPSPSDKGGLKEWAKKHLQSLGRALAKLAGKAAAALPGIIGSIVSWLLNLLAKTAGWLAENMWVMALAVGGLLLVAARDWLASSKKPKSQ